VAFTEAAAMIMVHDAVEEFLAYGIWRLSEGWEVEVEMRESPLSKVVMPMLKVTAIIRKQEVGQPSKHELLRWQIS
jgi:hypothetical protein